MRDQEELWVRDWKRVQASKVHLKTLKLKIPQLCYHYFGSVLSSTIPLKLKKVTRLKEINQ